MTETRPSLLRPDRLTPEQKALLYKRDGLDLSRRRVLHDLETSTSIVYRKNLEAGLAFLDSEIAEVDRLLVRATPESPQTTQTQTQARKAAAQQAAAKKKRH